MSAFAVITKDTINTGRYADESIEGRFLTTNHVRPDETVRFRLLDDDRNPYFEGVASDNDDLLEAILNSFMGGWGCTILQVPSESGAWEDYMN